jgi:virginiamycin B lyase
MPVEVHELMVRAAEEPVGAPHIDVILRRASQRRRRSLGTVTAAMLVVVAGVAAAVGAWVDSDGPPKVAARPPVASRVGTITLFPLPTPSRDLTHIARGPDRSLWFARVTDESPRLGRISIDGAIREIPISSGGIGVTGGKDGKAYFAQTGALARITPDTEHVESFPLPEPGATPLNLTTAPNGDIWMTQEFSSPQLWRFRTGTGTFERVQLPDAIERPDAITSDGKGNIWVADMGGRIVRIDRQGNVAVYPVPGSPFDSVGFGITAGPNGNTWFTGFTDVIGRATPSGHITQYSVPSASNDAGRPRIVGITAGADGNLWFANLAAQTIGRITPKGKITEYPIEPQGQLPSFLTAGADGNIWFTTFDSIGRITTGAGSSPRRR